MTVRTTLPVTGLHHLKIPVSDLATTRAWYEELLGLVPELEFEDDAGVVRGVVYETIGEFQLALREDPERAGALVGFDPFALAVRTRDDLDTVVRVLDEHGVTHGGIITATLGWLVAAEDPEGRQVRFYTTERHSSPS